MRNYYDKAEHVNQTCFDEIAIKHKHFEDEANGPQMAFKHQL